MDKNKIIQYIDQGKEIELLEQLELLGLDQYDDRYKRLIKILIILLTNSKINFLPIQQFLFKAIFTVLDKILSNEQSIKEFVEIMKTDSNEDHGNISSFVSRFILNIKDNVEVTRGSGNIEPLEVELKRLNIDFLMRIISEKKEYKSIIEALYNCVEDLEEDRKIILHPDAIAAFKEYLKENPKDYLSHFIRPYYTGPTKEWSEYYLHVSEPFCQQIFKDPDFDQFLEGLSPEDVDKTLLTDIRSFYKIANSNPKNNTDRVVMLFSHDNKQSYNPIDHLKLLSNNHEYVREPCKPPNYTGNQN